MENSEIDLNSVYGVGWCPCCGQGEILMIVDDSGELFLMCEECFSQWIDPEKVSVCSGQIDRETYEFHHYAWFEEVEEKKWVHPIINYRSDIYYRDVYPQFRGGK